MKNLWSPWRSEYIETHAGNGGGNNTGDAAHCFLCDAVSASEFSASNLVVSKSNHAIVVLNKYPYNAGHLLIAPSRHTPELQLLEESEYNDLMHVLRQSIEVVKSVLKPHGFNIGANIGVDAGAGVPGHLHLHVVPRWRGDTNFMPSLSEIKVVSESLEKTWQQFYQAFNDNAPQ